MKRCEELQGWMAEALYGELDADREREFGAHTEGCAECATLYAQMRATLETMSSRRRPDPGSDFWDGYWQRLEERIAREPAVADASRLARRWSPGSWGYRVAAAAVVLAAGIWIGRSVLAPSPSTHTAVPVETARDEVAVHQPAIDAPASEAGAQPDAGRARDGGGPVATLAASGNDDAWRYIDRSQVVLLALLNGGDSGTHPADYAAARQRAGVLLAEGSGVRDGLTRPEDRRLRQLVEQLEMILREIANLEADSDLDAVELIRNRVGREGVLLQIDLQQMRESSPEKVDAGARAPSSGF
ncbi:MAG TPA: zf-HC2 domain-containing protein [Candidatus Krumholzibacteria bacterium]|nr:zf-HC2 domain-containing protein [Candidatus Krumholzibacteria bacterium]